jgi:hypothetical protein
MLLAIAGILMIVALLGFAAFLVGREHTHEVEQDYETSFRPTYGPFPLATFGNQGAVSSNRTAQ